MVWADISSTFCWFELMSGRTNVLTPKRLIFFNQGILGVQNWGILERSPIHFYKKKMRWYAILIILFWNWKVLLLKCNGVCFSTYAPICSSIKSKAFKNWRFNTVKSILCEGFPYFKMKCSLKHSLEICKTLNAKNKT